MTVHLILLLHLCLVSYFTGFSNCHTVLYRTENSPSVQSYDCVYAPDRDAPYAKYCRQSVENQRLERGFSESCYNDGELWSFEKLVQWNISVSDVLTWSSSMEQTDRYAKYLFNSSLDVGERYLCNCINPSSFGKFCEYTFYYGEIEFADAMIEQFKPLKIEIIHVGSQLHNNRPCYLTLTCDSGLLCLDWRYICDGKQQCTDGIDEDHCELLEFNECEEDEYRCANGMCIPEEYWLDGGYDCMDWTDEIKTKELIPRYCFHSPAIVCDERLCLFRQWSCGNGECIIQGTDRHRGDRAGPHVFCENLRDIQFICATVTRNSQSWWTINGGYCLPYSLPYQTLNLDTTDLQDTCLASVKCALGRSLNENCICKNTVECRAMITRWCQERYIFFPNTVPIIAPFIFIVYTSDHDWTKKRPDIVVLHGQLKCLDHQLVIYLSVVVEIAEDISFFDHHGLEHFVCTALGDNVLYRNYSGPQYDANCWNNSKTFNNRSYQVSFLCQTRCISKYRVRDGLADCQFSEERYDINNSCPEIQRHRLQCSSSELTCLITAALANVHSDCSNKRDEIDYENGKILFESIHCQEGIDPGCVEIRDYIHMSSQKDPRETLLNDHSLADNRSTYVFPFRSYCNSFFDLKEGSDELPELCQVWSCLFNQYQCLSGQCIPSNWVCDGEWDCRDASDEQGLFIIDRFSDHNARFLNLTDTKAECHQRYRPDNTPFGNVCHIWSEYPCFRADVDDPFNVTLNRPCINLTVIGNAKKDCLTGLDERNRLPCAADGMLGYNYQYNQSKCMFYPDVCSGSYRWIFGENDTYGGICFYRRRLSLNDTGSDCDGRMDVMCLNNTCIRNARCNGQMQCPYGEDEYRCIPAGINQYIYRSEKQRQFFEVYIRLPNYPSIKQSLQTKLALASSDEDHHRLHTVDKKRSLLNFPKELVLDDYLATVYENRHHQNRSTYEIVRDALPNETITFRQHYLPFICNRGIAIKYHTGHTVCFCPPSAYGAQCEFFSDRITVLTHLNLTNYRPISDQIAIIKVLVTFLFENEIIDYHEFHVDPWREKDRNYIKHLIYFLYPRTERFLQMKKTRRNGTQLYSVRFEVFDLYSNGKIQPIGVWHYPIYFDFLPAFRLAKILHFQSPALPISYGSCSKNPCGVNGICQEILNSNHSSYFCSCYSGYYGTECQSYDEECKSYCSVESVCRPDYRRMITGNRQPLCLCPASTLGSTCFVRKSQCQSNPCLHGGTCVALYNLTNIYSYVCVCTDAFDGKHCESPRKILDITVILSAHSMFQRADILATTVFYSSAHTRTFELLIEYQQVFESLPSRIQLIYNRHSSTDLPPMGIMKVYGSNYHRDISEYYLLYIDIALKNYSITSDLTSENHCPLVQTLWHLLQNVEASNTSQNMTYNSSTAVFFYHNLCRSRQNTNRTLTCFRDSKYLCVCEMDYSRAECFIDKLSTDRCSHCLSNGYCLQSDVNVRNDFLCLCPRCHHGKRCEYSTELMSFSLDSLVVKDIQRSQQVSSGIFISITLLIFVLGLFNNISSFFTFIRRKVRKFGVGNYLLIISIVDQCSLLFLLFKFIHIILGTNGTLFSHRNLNLYSCKILSYLLSVFTRLTYWLTSFVTIERLCMVLFPTSTTLKNPRLALGLSVFATLMLCGMHVHEVLYYTTIEDLSYTSANVTLCVTNYTQSLVSTYNRVNILLHYFIPFLIQTISITIMIVRTASSRARTSGNHRNTFGEIFRQQLKTQKELYITPLIIILSSLPQTILSFSYACGGFNQSWQRYTLLAAYFFSYLPQVLGFILYVLPSTVFSEEFRQTSIGKIVFRQRQSSTIERKTTKRITFKTASS